MQTPAQPSSFRQAKNPRPTGVTVVGIIVIIGGIFGLFRAIPILISNPTTTQLVLASVVVLFSILAFAIGPGLLMSKNWAWTFAVGFYAVSIPLGIIEVFIGGNVNFIIGGIIRAIIGIIFVYYLMRSSAKLNFKYDLKIIL